LLGLCHADEDAEEVELEEEVQEQPEPQSSGNFHFGRSMQDTQNDDNVLDDDVFGF
jgi:hypothetical protein